MLALFKQLARNLAYRPRLRRIGTDSFVRLPRRIFNPDRIEIGDRTTIHSRSIIYPLVIYEDYKHDGHIVIGDDVYIGGGCQLFAINTLAIGSGSVLSEYVYINDSSHGFDPNGGLIMKQPLWSKGPISIGKNCFLGYGVIVMPGVTLGDWCIVGSRSIVTRSFPAYSMIVGSPARLIKRYCPERMQWIAGSEIEHVIA